MNNLTEEQKVFISTKVEEGFNDYVLITNLMLGRDNLTGRDKECKLVRDFLVDVGVVKKKGKSKTAPISVVSEEILTPSHIEFIDQNIKSGLSPRQVTELLFNKDLQGAAMSNIFITPQYRAVQKYIKETHPDFLVENESAVNEKYSTPRSINTVVDKVNRWCGQSLSKDKLSLHHRKCMEKLLTYLSSPRFVQNYDSYRSASDKDLFEAEFVRSTWDKSDLTIDEINLYVNVCMDYVNLKQIDNKKNKINDIFNDTQEQKDLTIRLTETLKTISEEYNQCAQRIDRSLQKLNGERAKRIDHHHQKNASIINLVELFQDEQERKMMIRIADLQNRAVAEEADRLENMSSWKARILGISKEDAL